MSGNNNKRGISEPDSVEPSKRTRTHMVASMSPELGCAETEKMPLKRVLPWRLTAPPLADNEDLNGTFEDDNPVSISSSPISISDSSVCDTIAHLPELDLVSNKDQDDLTQKSVRPDDSPSPKKLTNTLVICSSPIPHHDGQSPAVGTFDKSSTPDTNCHNNRIHDATDSDSTDGVPTAARKAVIAHDRARRARQTYGCTSSSRKDSVLWAKCLEVKNLTAALNVYKTERNFYRKMLYDTYEMKDDEDDKEGDEGEDEGEDEDEDEDEDEGADWCE